jgi:superfamily I DNA/RNA helicase
MGDNLSTEEITALQQETATGEVSEETIQEQALSGADTVKQIFDGKTLDEGMEFFAELKRASAGAKKNTSKEAVFLGTMHSWKGLECRDMYCPMTAGKFPSFYSEDIESERRLAYVALTRGQDRVVVVSGKKGPSQFVREACIKSEKETKLVNASVDLNDFDLMYAMEQFLKDN